MTYNPEIHHRRWRKPGRHPVSIRLKGYDYSRCGLYFLTLCVKNREHLFGQITNGEMQLNFLGEIAQAEWVKTAEIRNNILLHEFIIMPNHLHGIIEIIDPTNSLAISETEAIDETKETKEINGRADAIRPNDREPTNSTDPTKPMVGAHRMRPTIGNNSNNKNQEPQKPSNSLAIDKTDRTKETKEINGRADAIRPNDGELTNSTDPTKPMVGAHRMRPTIDNNSNNENQEPQAIEGTDEIQGKTATIGDIIRGYKSAVTRRINELRDSPSTPIWQRNYYENIIRSETDYLEISAYIQNNPQRWIENNENLGIP